MADKHPKSRWYLAHIYHLIFFQYNGSTDPLEKDTSPTNIHTLMIVHNSSVKKWTYVESHCRPKTRYSQTTMETLRSCRRKVVPFLELDSGPWIGALPTLVVFIQTSHNTITSIRLEEHMGIARELWCYSRLRTSGCLQNSVENMSIVWQ